MLELEANPNNMFARINSFAALDDNYEILLSPENLYADGERTRTQAKAFAVRIRKDYEERRNELVFS